MAPKYKLTYFNSLGLAEPIRYILSHAGADFEDVRVSREQWPAVKKDFPFGKIPVLEVNGKQLYQSLAICRFLAREFGLDGADSWENQRMDAIVDTIVDFRLAASSVKYADESTKAQKEENFEKEVMPLYFSRLEEIVKENGEYLVGNKLSWADLYLSYFIEIFTKYKGYPLDKYPNLKRLVDKVWSSPNIKAWRERRPESD